MLAILNVIGTGPPIHSWPWFQYLYPLFIKLIVWWNQYHIVFRNLETSIRIKWLAVHAYGGIITFIGISVPVTVIVCKINIDAVLRFFAMELMNPLCSRSIVIQSTRKIFSRMVKSPTIEKCLNTLWRSPAFSYVDELYKLVTSTSSCAVQLKTHSDSQNTFWAFTRMRNWSGSVCLQGCKVRSRFLWF